MLHFKETTKSSRAAHECIEELGVLFMETSAKRGPARGMHGRAGWCWGWGFGVVVWPLKSRIVLWGTVCFHVSKVVRG